MKPRENYKLNKMNYLDEDELETSSYSNNAKTLTCSYGGKKSFFLYSSKNFVEDLQIQKPPRKLTIEPHPTINLLNFAPRPKMKEVQFIPSKLQLNPKGIKDQKRNKNNPILLETNQYYISCPNSDEIDSNDENANYSQMKGIREKMSHIKSKIPKVLSNIAVCENEDEIFNLFSNDDEKEKEKDIYNNSIDDNREATFEDDDYISFKNNINKRPKTFKKRERTYSFTILEMLKGKSRKDK